MRPWCIIMRTLNLSEQSELVAPGEFTQRTDLNRGLTS